MRAVGIRALKDQLSEYVRLAATGEIVLVTDRDVVVAELGPPRAERTPTVADALLADLIRQGVLTPAPLAGAGPPPTYDPGPAGIRSGDVQAELAKDREDR